MSPDLRPIEEQTIVITGASSGIGLTTARMAAERGANVVAAARSEDALADLVEEIREEGGEAEYVVADVREREEVREIADVAEEAFGGIDTWINGAAGFVYGELRETPIEDMRSVFETNVWGLLYGSLEAADRMEEEGGALINIGSVVSDRAIILQGAYSASKHAAKGFTDTLRMELEREDVPISVTLIKPAAIDTPYTEHAKNHMDKQPSFPPPVYTPEEVGKSILHAAQHPERDVYVGSGAKGMAAMGRLAPRLMDRIMETAHYDAQRTDRIEVGDEGENVLDQPVGEGEARGDYEGRVRKRSFYTRTMQHRSLLGAAVAGLAGGVLAFARRRGRDGDAGLDFEEITTESTGGPAGGRAGERPRGQLFADRDDARRETEEGSSGRVPTILAQSARFLTGRFGGERS